MLLKNNSYINFVPPFSAPVDSFDQEGNFLLLGATDLHVYVLDARPSRRFGVIGYTGSVSFKPLHPFLLSRADYGVASFDDGVALPFQRLPERCWACPPTAGQRAARCRFCFCAQWKGKAPSGAAGCWRSVCLCFCCKVISLTIRTFA